MDCFPLFVKRKHIHVLPDARHMARNLVSIFLVYIFPPSPWLLHQKKVFFRNAVSSEYEKSTGKNWAKFSKTFYFSTLYWLWHIDYYSLGFIVWWTYWEEIKIQDYVYILGGECVVIRFYVGKYISYTFQIIENQLISNTFLFYNHPVQVNILSKVQPSYDSFLALVKGWITLYSKRAR